MMTRSLMYSVSLPVQHNSNSVFVVTFSCSHDNVFLVCFPKFLTCLASKFHSSKLHHICIFKFGYHFFNSFIECIDRMFFCSTTNAMFLLFVFSFSLFFFSVVPPHRSLHPLFILLLHPSFMLFDVMLPLSFLSLLFFLLLLLPSLLSSSIFRKYSGTSPSTLWCFSLPPPFSYFFSFCFLCYRFLASCMPESLRQLVELLPAASFTCTSVASLVSLCCRVDVTTRSLPFVPSSLSRLSTAHSRSEDFLIAIFPFDLQPQVQCLGT